MTHRTDATVVGATGTDGRRATATPSPAAALLLSDRQRDQVDQMVATMSHLVQDGDFLAEGIGTFLPTAAYMLAKHTHAPDCTSLCPNGNSLVTGVRTLTLGHDEFDTVPGAAMWLDYQQINLAYMPAIFIGERPRWTEFMRPAQIDPMGATNNVCIGPHARPRVRLPGSAGIPDASTVAPRFYYYAPRHSRQLFVPQLDFCSGAGHPGAGAGNPRCVTVVTNLGVLVSGPSGRLHVTQLHPGVTREEIAGETGFELDWADDVKTSTPPTDAELGLLDATIDPRGLRFLEALTGASRRTRLRALATEDASA